MKFSHNTPSRLKVSVMKTTKPWKWRSSFWKNQPRINPNFYPKIYIHAYLTHRNPFIKLCSLFFHNMLQDCAWNLVSVKRITCYVFTINTGRSISAFCPRSMIFWWCLTNTLCVHHFSLKFWNIIHQIYTAAWLLHKRQAPSVCASCEKEGIESLGV